MNAATKIVLLLFAFLGNLLAQERAAIGGNEAAVLDRAIACIGGPSALQESSQFRVVYVGHSNSVDQSRDPGHIDRTRRQETLIIDYQAHQAALRSEGVQTDGSPSMWRLSVLGDKAYDRNLKTNRQWSRSAEEEWGNLVLRIPQLALREMKANVSTLHWSGNKLVRGRRYIVLLYSSPERPDLRVLFENSSGVLAGYESTAQRLRGQMVFRFMFKPYQAFDDLKKFPSGWQLIGGRQIYSDLNVIYATTGTVRGDPWLKPPPQDVKTPSVLRHPQAIEEIAPGILHLTNFGGYNLLAVDLGRCFAVLDAPAQFSNIGKLPASPSTVNHTQLILDALQQQSPGKPVCYVIPTHYHDDHFGGIRGFAAQGATVITSEGNALLAREVLQAADPDKTPKIEVVKDWRAMGEGDNHFEIYVLHGGFHVRENIFFYFPARGFIFEADISDYDMDAKYFLNFVRQKNLAIKSIYSAHSSGTTTLQDWQDDEPGN